MRRQFWVTVGVGGFSALLAVVTLISREWIELIFGVDPDNGDGSLEWAIVIGAGAIAACCLAWARIEWRLAHAE
jgi:hypothetical protein